MSVCILYIDTVPPPRQTTVTMCRGTCWMLCWEPNAVLRITTQQRSVQNLWALVKTTSSWLWETSLELVWKPPPLCSNGQSSTSSTTHRYHWNSSKMHERCGFCFGCRGFLFNQINICDRLVLYSSVQSPTSLTLSEFRWFGFVLKLRFKF